MNCNTCKQYPCEWVSELQRNGVTTTEIIKKELSVLNMKRASLKHIITKKPRSR